MDIKIIIAAGIGVANLGKIFRKYDEEILAKFAEYTGIGIILAAIPYVTSVAHLLQKFQ